MKNLSRDLSNICQIIVFCIEIFSILNMDHCIIVLIAAYID